ncbi:MAG: PQQ-binding-like beta-propeller repeat protein [Pseudomonadota bacterium]
MSLFGSLPRNGVLCGIWVTALTSVLLLGGCSQDSADKTTNTGPAGEVAATELDEVDPNSMEAIQAAALAREQLPGRAHFDRACATCHTGAVPKAPHREMIGLMTPESILATLTDGVMQQEASILTASEKIEVAEYLAGRPMGQEVSDIPSCSEPVEFDALAPALAGNWGIQQDNSRYIDAATAGFSAADVSRLQPSWAVSFPGANRVRSQPALAGGLMFVGSHNGRVYALDQQSGCQVWSYQAAGEVRTGIVVSPWQQTDTTTRLFFGDVLGNVYGLDARSGAELWRIRADDHPNATITGSPSYHGGSLYIPVSSLEVSLAIDPNYACCTFRGSIVAVDAASGEQQWKTYTIEEEPRVQRQNAVGTDMIGPSGAVVWNSPSIDLERRQIYFGTGENMSSPATLTSDALFALDMDTGKVNWVFQGTANDAWNVACDTSTPENCPDENGPDFDFGGATILVTDTAVGDLVVAGQKSGLVHAVNPDSGALVWQTRVGRGGIQGGIHFGIAAANDKVFVPISDMADGREYPDPDRPGMHALDVNTGKILWSTLHEDSCEGRAFCHPGISQVPTVVGDVVFAGSMDGTLRAYATNDGTVLWQLDTTESFATILGADSAGGSFSGGAGPIAFDGQLIISSGYGLYNHMPGNLLLTLRAAAE